MTKYGAEEILETLRMIQLEHLDIRTVTMGISLRDCASGDIREACGRIHDKIVECAKDLVAVAREVEEEYGIPIINKRIAVTPIALISDNFSADELLNIARTLDGTAEEVGVDFLGGYSALVHKGYTGGDEELISSIPRALASTKRLCASVNVATTRAGINMDAVRQMGVIIKETAELTGDENGIGCAKLVVFANAVEDNPFMAGAFHGVGEPDCVVNVGVSGPGVIQRVVRDLGDVDFGTLAEAIKRTAFKIVRAGELIGRTVAKRLAVEFGAIDLSLAPTPTVGDSVARILEGMGLERCGAPGTTAALALLTDAVKKGGAMAGSLIGGLSGAFIPVSEDEGMAEAVKIGALTLEKLEAMTSVCSVGLDMVAVPGDTSADTISAIIADEMAIGVINNKTTGVRIIPIPGKSAGEIVRYGGLLGESPILTVSRFDPSRFVRRGGRIPPPLNSLTN
ncbi:MAG: PFL family protein [bacterium]